MSLLPLALAAALVYASSFSMSAHFSPIIIVVMHGFTEIRSGIAEPSATRRPSTP